MKTNEPRTKRTFRILLLLIPALLLPFLAWGSAYVTQKVGASLPDVLVLPIVLLILYGPVLPLCVGTVSLPFAIDALRHGESKRKNTLMLLIALFVIVLSTLLLWELHASWSQGFEITFM